MPGRSIFVDTASTEYCPLRTVHSEYVVTEVSTDTTLTPFVAVSFYSQATQEETGLMVFQFLTSKVSGFVNHHCWLHFQRPRPRVNSVSCFCHQQNKGNRASVDTKHPQFIWSFHGGRHTHEGILYFVAPSIHPPIDWLIVVLFVERRDVAIASYRFLWERSLPFANSYSSGSHTISQHKTLSNDR
jgi:hypothetical protein